MVRVDPGIGPSDLGRLGPAVEAAGWSGVSTLQLATAAGLAARRYPPLDPDGPALVLGLASAEMAAEVKVVLLAQYPASHDVRLIDLAPEPPTSRVSALGDLDAGKDSLGDLAALAVPPLPRPASVGSLADVVARLRAPDGCPWDREQTHESLRPYLLEEAHEVLGALDAGNARALCDELGDLLLQIVLHAQLAHEDGDFELVDVVAAEREKIVRRHPHVFGRESARTTEEVLRHWEATKKEERRAGGKTDALAHVPRTLPALALAEVVQRKLPRLKVPQEAARAALAPLLAPPPDGAAARSAALGEALWAAVALAGAWGTDAEAALRSAVASRIGRGDADPEPR